MNDPTKRFSDRVENYVRWRPSYPVAVLETLRAECGLSAATVVADIGSGTGILTHLILENGNRVYGVEPNAEMRKAAESLLRDFPGFVSVAGTAENTGLGAASIDLLVAAQAFHWFDPAKTKKEFQRILRAGGWVALVWNERLVGVSPFLREYEELLKRYATDYATVDHRNVGDDAIAAFFHPGPFTMKSFPNRQEFDFEALKGRCLSSSYTPAPGAPGYDELVAGLRETFERNQVNGKVSFEYQTKLYYGRLWRCFRSPKAVS